MAYTTINKSTDYFNTKLWTGTGSSNAITGVGFQPDWVWIKNRSATESHRIHDAVRGTNKSISSDTNDTQTTTTQDVMSFDSDGFTLGTETAVNANGQNIVGWNWKANGQGSSNTDGTINTTYTSVNTTSGFSISTYTGTGSNATIGHGLGAVPKMILLKKTSGTANWFVYHSTQGATKYLHLNTTSAVDTASSVWNNTAPTSSLFSVGNSADVNGSGATYVAYCFADIQGFSKASSYTGNGNANGSFIYTGFKPAWIMIKKSDGSGDNWFIFDSKRAGYNVENYYLHPDTAGAEGTTDYLDIVSNGFKLRTSGSDLNGSGKNFIYMAFAEAPLVGSNNVPANAR